MQQRSCSYGEPTACDGRMSDCPLCGDRVCDGHAVDGLCLACQDDEQEAEATEEKMTWKQWNALSEAISIARTLCRSRIEDCKAHKWNADMYERWLGETEVAGDTLQALSRSIHWAKEEVA